MVHATSTRRWQRPGLALTAALVCLVALAATGCGSSNDDSSSGATSKAATSQDAAYLASARKDIDALFTKTGTFKSPPTTSPPPAAGKKVWLISCGQAYIACSVPIGAAKRATDALGWDGKIFDDKGDPATAVGGIRQAIADGADGIYVFYIDCRYIKSGLQDAKKAGIPVVAAQSADCNQTDPGAPKLFDHVASYTGSASGEYPNGQGGFRTWVRDWGRIQAMYSIVKQQGHANAIIYADDTGWGNEEVANAMLEEYKKCRGCKAEIIHFPYADLGKSLKERTAQDLLKRPKVNTVLTTYDAITADGVADAAKAAGRPILVMLGEGNPGAADLIRDGKADFGAGMSLMWDSYSSIDTLNRMFNKQPLAPSGVGHQLYDKTHNLPAKGGYRTPFEFEKIYQQAWKSAQG